MTLSAMGPTTGLQPDHSMQHIDRQLLRRALAAYTTRFVSADMALGENDYFLETGVEVRPQPGDVVLARVLEIGQHTRLESPVSRRQLLFPGQPVLLAYGHRYAPDQFHAVVPPRLEPCHLIAAGGLAGWVTEKHEAVDDPTTIEPLGLLHDGNGRVTLARHAPLTTIAASGVSKPEPRVIAVLGSSMNAGKSTTLACLAYGFTAAGLRVAAGKVTGTGAGGDPNLYRDGGALRVLDFTDFGYPTTYRVDDQDIDDLLASMVTELSAAGPDVVLIEVADGVYQDETSRLLHGPVFAALVDDVVFAARDALGAAAGLEVLNRAGARVLAVSGTLTTSPLLTREAAAVLPVPVIETFGLTSPTVTADLLARAELRAPR